jgi:hypothetical protein
VRLVNLMNIILLTGVRGLSQGVDSPFDEHLTVPDEHSLNGMFWIYILPLGHGLQGVLLAPIQYPV